MKINIQTHQKHIPKCIQKYIGQGSIVCIILMLLISCVVPSEEKTKFKQDSFIDEEAIRDRLAKHVEYHASIGYMSYAISVGEVVLRLDYELGETLQFVMDTEPLEKIALKKAKYVRKHFVDIHVRNQKYEFNDYETEIWLSGLLSALSYVIVYRDSPEEMGAVSVETVGEIFTQTVHQYIAFEPKQLTHIEKHPVFKKYYELLENKASEEEIDIFYASIFKVSADTMYLIPRDNDGNIELLKEKTEQVKVYKNITDDENDSKNGDEDKEAEEGDVSITETAQ